MRRPAIVAFLILVLWSLPRPFDIAQGRPALRGQAIDPTFERLAAYVAERLKEYQVPGASVGIVRDGSVATRGFGVTNVDHPLPVTDGTLFQVGSISKTFVGTTIMRLVEQGRIRLDAPVRTYLPSFAVRDAAASRDATVMDLLTHMGGWEGDVFEDTGQGDDALAKYVAQLKDTEQVTPLRTVWSYNNAGFIVAGRIVETVTGKPYEDALQELVLGPLALKDTYITPADVMTLRFAVGHGGGPPGPAVLRPWPIGRYAHPAGGVISTAGDLLKYAQFHMGDGTSGGARVLAADTLRRMHTSVLVKQGADEEMAVTWHVSTVGGVRRLNHGGSTLGQQALLTLVPERRVAIALLTNGARGGRLNQDVTRWVLKEYLGVDDRDPEPIPTQPTVAAFAGRYSRPYADVVVTAEDGRLLVQTIQKRGFPNASSPVPPPGPKAPCSFYAPDRAVAVDGPLKGSRVEFIRNADGSLAYVRVGGRIYKRTGATS